MENRQILNTVLEKIDTLVIVVDFETNTIIYADDQIKEIDKNIIGKKCWEFLFPNDQRICRKCIENEKLAQKNKFYSCENNISLERNWLIISNTEIDWTEEKKARLLILKNPRSEKFPIQELAFSEQRFKALSDASFEAIFIIKEGYIIETNKTVFQIFGYEKNELNGKFASIIIAPESRDAAREKMLTGYEEHYESFGIKKDGTRINIEIRGKMIDYRGEKVRVTAIRDITKRKQAELELQKREKQLYDLNATKDKFFSIIAHDLRNPFNQLFGLTDLILQNFNEYSFSELKEYIGLLNKSAKNGHNLLENLLEWARSQSGRKEVNPFIFKVKQIVDKVIEILSITAEAKNIKIYSNITSEYQIFADANMTNTIFMNLLSNAIKFTPNNGKVVLDAKDLGDEIQFSVKDNGVGISEANIKKLFRIDLHHSTKGTNNEAGTGLGLILCNEFISLSKGKIWVESQKNIGSTFYFTLPKYEFNNN